MAIADREGLEGLDRLRRTGIAAALMEMVRTGHWTARTTAWHADPAAVSPCPAWVIVQRSASTNCTSNARGAETAAYHAG
jgi:hypothetical protein